jgi:hypothetical protein
MFNITRALWIFVSFIGIIGIVTLGGCDEKTSTNNEVSAEVGEACVSSSDCIVGLVCNDSVCHSVCSSDLECPKDHSCENTLCIPVNNPVCISDDVCVSATPPACHILAGAECWGGTCKYLLASTGSVCENDDLCTSGTTCDASGVCGGGNEIVCDQPPVNQCTNDSLCSAYTSMGVCDSESGECSYTPVATPTTSGACADECNDCSFRFDGAPCLLTEESSGVCHGSQCVECLSNNDCTTPPFYFPMCYETATCNTTSNSCNYIPVTGSVLCAEAGCYNSTLYNDRYCSDGDCPLGVVISDCGGYGCTSDDSACLTSCGSDELCDLGYHCKEGVCEEDLEPGGLCQSDSECVSGFCDDSSIGPLTGRCCAGPECCIQDVGDCPVGQLCRESLALCQDGTVGDVCDDNDDCNWDNNQNVCTSNQICEFWLENGESICDEGIDCQSGNCDLAGGANGTCCPQNIGQGYEGQCCNGGSDLDCPVDYYCQASTSGCVDGNEGHSCDDDEDCDNLFSCSDENLCVVVNTSCMSDMDCTSPIESDCCSTSGGNCSIMELGCTCEARCFI